MLSPTGRGPGSRAWWGLWGGAGQCPSSSPARASSPTATCNVNLFVLTEKEGGKMELKSKCFLVNFHNK